MRPSGIAAPISVPVGVRSFIMASLLELVERVNKNETIDPESLDCYQESANSAERFLSNHARAMLELRKAQQHLMQSLEAIDYGDQKVLSQFLSVASLAGAAEQRCGPMVRFGGCAIGRRDYALGVEAIQSGMAFDLQHGGSFSSDRENCLLVAGQYRRAAEAIGYQAPARAPMGNMGSRQPRIGYVCSQIADDDGASRMPVGLARYCQGKDEQIYVYSTEAFVRRERQQFMQSTYLAPSNKRGREMMEMLGRAEAQVWTAPTDGDAISAAKELANQIARDQIDILILDVTQADAAANLLACWDVAPVKIAIARRSAIYCTTLQGCCYTDSEAHEADMAWWQSQEIKTWFVQEGVDASLLPQAATQRSTFGIPESAVVLATASPDLDRAMNDSFIDCIVSILRSNPQAIFMAAGDGELTAAKKRFEAAGMSRRVGWAPKRKDIASFLRIADVYLADFPMMPGSAGTCGIMSAMSVGCPIVAMKGAAGCPSPAALAGEDCCVPLRDTAGYAQEVGKLIHEPAMRQAAGKLLQAKAQQQFSFAQTAGKLEGIWQSLRSSGSKMGNTPEMRIPAATPMPQSMDEDDDDILVQVA
jgi:hypothetical protein